MKIAFCIIAKGDSDLPNLKRLVESALPAVQTVHITCNHKPHDKVWKWCKEKSYDFSYLPWSDSFSDQRNYNFERAPKDTDYILWADADDVIINADLIPDIARLAKGRDLDGVFFTYWYGNEFEGEPSPETFKAVELQQLRERLLRPGSIVWKKRLHESPVPLDGQRYSYTTVEYSETNPVVWMHLGADRDEPQEVQEARMSRNRRLLEMDLADERSRGESDPRTLLYLMKIYAEDEEPEILKKLIDMGNEYIANSGWDQERAVCYKLMSVAYGKLGQHRQAADMLHNALKEFPYDPLLNLYLSRAYFNLENYSAMKHWMDVALTLEVSQKTSQMNNLLELKILTAELALQYNLHGNKNIRKAYEAAKLLNKINPTPNNQNNENYLFNQKELDIASEHAHKLMKYFDSIGQSELIPKLYEALPQEMARLPFALSAYNKFKEPKIWKDNEICYYATFGGEHFENWGPRSLVKGIGGSETAVIRLAREWANLGYKVTIYGDPGDQEGSYDGVTYLPYYKFNPRDKFNIFIQWRNNNLAGKVSAKKFLVDLHDEWSDYSYIEKQDAIDSIMVKSNYHKTYGENLPDEKFTVISNGIL